MPFAVDAYASLPHYAAHIKPVWDALPDWARGEFYAARQSPWATAPLPGRRASLERRLTIVASYTDAHKFAHRPCVLIEHGAGQSYPGDPRSARSPSYAGGDSMGHVVLFLSPRTEVAAAWKKRYPSAIAHAVGCPRLDRWHATPSVMMTRPTDVAITWHWEGELIAETLSAFRHYCSRLPEIRAAVEATGHKLIGHAHPRMWGGVRRAYDAAGIEMVESLDEVFTRAAMLIADNTSALPEFASIGRPVIWLDAPWYRRGVWHGGRFWDWPTGQVSASGPEPLVGAIAVGLADPPTVAQARWGMVNRVYAYTDGRAAARAVAAIMALAG